MRLHKGAFSLTFGNEYLATPLEENLIETCHPISLGNKALYCNVANS